MILKGNLNLKHERELWEDKFICSLGTKARMGLNIELKHYRRELYEAFADLTAQNMELLLNLPVRTFSVYTVFQRKNRRRKRPRLNTIYSLHMVIFVTAITVYIFSTTLWLPRDSRSGKNRQRGGTFKSLNFVGDNEKTHLNRVRTPHSQLIRAKSHLYFLEKRFKHGVYPENLNVRDHFQIAFNTPKSKKAYSDLNKNSRNEEINRCISHNKLLPGKISEDIGEQKVCLTRFSTDQR